eukprot:scaffold179448_cov21-Tisochrysis_lutea.AAC.1
MNPAFSVEGHGEGRSTSMREASQARPLTKPQRACRCAGCRPGGAGRPPGQPTRLLPEDRPGPRQARRTRPRERRN